MLKLPKDSIWRPCGTANRGSIFVRTFRSLGRPEVNNTDPSTSVCMCNEKSDRAHLLPLAYFGGEMRQLDRLFPLLLWQNFFVFRWNKIRNCPKAKNKRQTTFLSIFKFKNWKFVLTSKQHWKPNSFSSYGETVCIDTVVWVSIWRENRYVIWIFFIVAPPFTSGLFMPIYFRPPQRSGNLSDDQG